MKQIAYEESFGQVRFPEGFEETLKGLSVEEQMARYRTTGSSRVSMTGWSERVYSGSYCRLERDPDVRALIVRDGTVVGVMINDDDGRDVPCLPEEWVCTYYDSENNGAGYKTRIDYTYLVCVPADFGRNA